MLIYLFNTSLIKRTKFTYCKVNNFLLILLSAINKILSDLSKGIFKSLHISLKS